MNTKNLKIIVMALVVIAIFVYFKNYPIRPTPTPILTMTESEARIIAEGTCIKGGETLSTGVYNQNTKTWWFDANLNAVKNGCNPACVVDELTKTAEINWRCTGLVTTTYPDPNDQICGIENCHGLDIKCGPNVPEACTMMYQIGDNCRQFATCEIIEGYCEHTYSKKFADCKTCVEKCIADNPDNNINLFTCESKCIPQ